MATNKMFERVPVAISKAVETIALNTCDLYDGLKTSGLVSPHICCDTLCST